MNITFCQSVSVPIHIQCNIFDCFLLTVFHIHITCIWMSNIFVCGGLKLTTTKMKISVWYPGVNCKLFCFVLTPQLCTNWCLPASVSWWENAEAERAFSAQNRIKSRLRTSLSVEHLDQLIRLTYAKVPIDKLNFDTAVHRFLSEKRRISVYLRLSIVFMWTWTCWRTLFNAWFPVCLMKPLTVCC